MTVWSEGLVPRSDVNTCSPIVVVTMAQLAEHLVVAQEVTCGSASGGSVKYDEVGIVGGSSLDQVLASRRCSAPGVEAAKPIDASSPCWFLRYEWPSTLRPLDPQVPMTVGWRFPLLPQDLS